MNESLTRRALISGCLALGMSACLPACAWAGFKDAFSPETVSDKEASTSQVPKMRQIIWHGLTFRIPLKLKWNDTGSYDETALETSVYSGIANGISYIVYVQKWQEKDFAPNMWENLLSCNLETWSGIATSNESILGNNNILYTEEYDNGTLRIVTACGSEDGQAEQKRVCSLATDGHSAWYILFILQDNGFDETSKEAANRILSSIEIATEEDVFTDSDWDLHYFVDKYDEPTNERYIMNHFWFEGNLDSAKELGTDVQIDIGISDFGAAFLEFKTKGTGKLLRGAEDGTSFTGSVRAGNGTEFDLSGTMEQDSTQLWLDTDTATEVIQAFMDGGHISFRLESDTSMREKYTFSVDIGDDFQKAYEFIQQ